VDTGLFGFEESTMGKTRAAYPPEFRRQMVELVRAGRSPEELAREFEPTAQSIRNWLAQCERNAGRGDGGKSGRKSTSGSKIKNTDPVYARNSAEMRIFPSCSRTEAAGSRHAGAFQPAIHTLQPFLLVRTLSG
jgi:transposase-like protein